MRIGAAREAEHATDWKKAVVTSVEAPVAVKTLHVDTIEPGDNGPFGAKLRVEELKSRKSRIGKGRASELERRGNCRRNSHDSCRVRGDRRWMSAHIRSGILEFVRRRLGASVTLQSLIANERVKHDERRATKRV